MAHINTNINSNDSQHGAAAGNNKLFYKFETSAIQTSQFDQNSPSTQVSPNKVDLIQIQEEATSQNTLKQVLEGLQSLNLKQDQLQKGQIEFQKELVNRQSELEGKVISLFKSEQEYSVQGGQEVSGAALGYNQLQLKKNVYDQQSQGAVTQVQGVQPKVGESSEFSMVKNTQPFKQPPEAQKNFLKDVLLQQTPNNIFQSTVQASTQKYNTQSMQGVCMGVQEASILPDTTYMSYKPNQAQKNYMYDIQSVQGGLQPPNSSKSSFDIYPSQNMVDFQPSAISRVRAISQPPQSTQPIYMSQLPYSQPPSYFNDKQVGLSDSVYMQGRQPMQGSNIGVGVSQPSIFTESKQFEPIKSQQGVFITSDISQPMYKPQVCIGVSPMYEQQNVTASINQRLAPTGIPNFSTSNQGVASTQGLGAVSQGTHYLGVPGIGSPIGQQPNMKEVFSKRKKGVKKKSYDSSSSSDISSDESEVDNQGASMLKQGVMQNVHPWFTEDGLEAQRRLGSQLMGRDFRDIGEYEDLHEYIDEFNRSYLSYLPDYEKIYELSIRLSPRRKIRQTAIRISGRFKTFSRFVSRLKELHGRSQEDVFKEFLETEQEDGETVTQYAERLETILSAPAGKFLKRDINKYIHQKLPIYFKNHINQFELGSRFSKLRKHLLFLERDQTHKEMREILQRTGYAVNASPTPALPQLQPESMPLQPPQPPKSQAYQYSRRFNQQGSSSQPQPPKGQPPQQGQYSKEKGTRKETSGVGASMFYQDVFPQHADVLVVDRKRGLGTIDESEEPDNFSSVQNTQGQGTSRAQGVNVDESEQVMDDTEAFERHYGATSQPTFAQPSFQKKPKFSSTSPNTQTARAFEYFSKQQLSPSELERVILQQRLAQDTTIMLDKGVFTDRDGNISFNRMMRSICYPMSLLELQAMESRWKKGQLPIYSIQEQMDEDIAQTERITETIVRVGKKGQHKCVKVLLNGYPIEAIIDPGAVQSMVSLALVEQCGLSSEISSIANSPTFLTISGSTNVTQELKDVELGFNSLSLKVDLPVVNEFFFGFIIGLDILENSLKNCVISFDPLQLEYLVGDKKVRMDMFSKSSPIQPILTCAEIPADVLDMWPKINLLQGPYNFCLADLPIYQQPFFNSRIPYETRYYKDFAKLKFVFDAKMAKDCGICIWGSGKLLQEVMYLLQVWQFQYRGMPLVWYKDTNRGLGFYTRSNVEFVLLATRGKFSQFRNSFRNVSQTFYALYDAPEKQLHSSKPTKFYEVLSRVFDLDKTKNVELFARVKDTPIQEKFDLYGHEVPGLVRLVQYPSQLVQQHVLLTDCEQQWPDSVMQVLPLNKLEDFSIFVGALDTNLEYKKNPQVLGVLARQFESFNYDHKIGLAKNIEMDLELLPGACVPKSPQLYLDKERKEFYEGEMQTWINKGYLEKGPVDVVINPVIVPKKGPKKWRMCGNFQPINEVTKLSGRQIVGADAERIISKGFEAKCMCSIDCAEAHQSIPATERARRFMGFQTRQGLMRSTRGQFGLTEISQVFNEGIHRVLGDLEEEGVFCYADDIVILARDFEHCLKLLEIVLQRLRENGYVVNSTKVSLFKQELNILGQLVSKGEVKIVPQRIVAIQDLPFPSSKVSLQKFIGLLNYVRKYLPNLSTMLAPLYARLKDPKEPFMLSTLQQQVIVQLKNLLSSYNVLALPNLKQPFVISISYTPFGYGAALLQEQDGILRPIAYRSKVLDADTSKPQFFIKLESLVQALQEWRQFVSLQKVTILTDHQMLNEVLKYRGDNLELNRLLVKVSNFRLEVVVKPASFKKLRFSALLIQEQRVQEYQVLDDLLLEYEQIRSPIRKVREAQSFDPAFTSFEYTGYFDGACTRAKCSHPLGAYGIVVYDRQGNKVLSKGGRVESENPTNNVSEAYGLYVLLQAIVDLGVTRFSRVQIIGDSELVVKQVKGTYRINSNGIRVILRQVKQVLKGFKNISFKNVPRAFNEEANDLAQDALKSYVNSELESVELCVFSIAQPNSFEQVCSACGRSDNQDQLLTCNRCLKGQHVSCLGELMYLDKQHFYCKHCEYYIDTQEGEKEDLTMDQSLLSFLRDREGFQASIGERRRVERLSKLFTLVGERLCFKDVDRIKIVPSIAERHQLLLDAHIRTGHSGVSNVCGIVRRQYFWPNMKVDAKQLLESCLFCQARKKPFLPMPSVFPTYKGLSAWQFVSVDLIGISGSSEFKYVLSVIDAFSKAPELIPIRDKRALTVMESFRDQVVFRYGMPLVVRCDEGREFMGEFREFVVRSGSQLIQNSPYYPQGNGLIERLNREIKQKLQSLANEQVFKGSWEKLVPMIAFAIRVAKHRGTGFSPFHIMYAREPLFPGQFESLKGDSFEEPCLERLTHIIDSVIRESVKINEQAALRLSKMDDEIRATTQARSVMGLTNLQLGDPLFVRNSERTTHLDLEVDGVSYFVKYMSPSRDYIVYYNPRTRRYLSANISNVKLATF